MGNTFDISKQEIIRHKARRQNVANMYGDDVQRVAQHEANVAVQNEVYTKANKIHTKVMALQEQMEEEQGVTQEIRANVTNILHDGCVHPIEKLEYHENYVSGSYLDKGYTDSWVTCTCCGQRFDERHVSSNSYG